MSEFLWLLASLILGAAVLVVPVALIVWRGSEFKRRPKTRNGKSTHQNERK